MNEQRKKHLEELDQIIASLTDANVYELLVKALYIQHQQKQWEQYKEGRQK